MYRSVILDVYNGGKDNGQNDKKTLIREINEQNMRLSKARELLLNDAIDANDYKIIKTECERKVNLFEAKLSSCKPKQESIEALIDKALYNLTHLDERYCNADIHGKRQIIGSIFPEKLQFENDIYRTTNINEAVKLIYSIGEVFSELEKEQAPNFESLSSRVVPAGFEPEQTVPKTVVLPLHHRTITRVRECKGNQVN